MVENSTNQSGSISRVRDFTLSNTFYDDLIRTFAPSNNSRFPRTETVEFLDTTNTSGASSRITRGGESNSNRESRSYTSSTRYSGSRVQIGNGTFDRGGSSSSSTNGSHLGRFNQRIIRMFDRDGDGKVSDQEVLDYVNARKNANQTINELIKGVNTNAALIINLVELADPNNDGVVSDQELIDAVLELRANSQEEIEQSLLDLVVSTNPNRAKVLQAVIGADLDKTGTISDIEVLTALLNESNLNLDQEILYKVLANNDQFEEIKAFLDTIDFNPDGDMSNEEVFNFLMAFRGSGFSIKKSDLIGFLNQNPNLTEIEKSIEYFDPNSNGDIDPSEFLAALLGIESGTEEGVHTSVLEILNNNPRYQSIKELFAAIDTNEDGEYTESELVKSWVNFKKGEINADEDIFNTVINSLSKTSNLSNILKALDTSENNSIENTELIDFILKLRSGEFPGLNSETLDAIYDLNEDSSSLKEAISIVDSDGDGLIGNQEAIQTILSDRRGELGIDQTTLETLLAYNENLAELYDVIDLVDVNKDGVFAEDEILDVLINQRRGVLEVTNPELLDDLIESSPNLQPAVTALNLFDPDENGYFEETNYIQALMQIRKGTATTPSTSLQGRIDSEIADSEMIKEVISDMDTDADGEISVSELLKNYAKTYITNGVADLGKKAVLDRVLAVSNPDAAEILALRAAIDTDNSGTISDEEAAIGILKVRSGELVNIGRDNLIELLSDNENVPAIYDAVEAIDSDADGVVANNEVFAELVENARAGIKDPTNAEDQVLSLNAKYADYKEIFEALDLNSDGSYTEAELVQSWVKFRKGELSLNQEDFYNAINELSGALSLTSFLEKIDVNADGNIDNTEMVDLMMDIRKNGINNIPAAAINAVYELNENKEILESAINAIDTVGDGVISTAEVVDAIISMRRRELAIDSQTFNQILDYNPNRAEIETLIDFIDTDGDGVFNKEEVFDSVLAVRKDPNTVSNTNLFNELINSAPDTNEVLSILNNYDPDSNGIFEEADYIKAQIGIRKGEIASPASSLLNKINTEVPESSLINELINHMDPNKNGVISPEELVTNYYSGFIINGVPNLERKAVLDRILAITNPGAQDILNIRSKFDLDNSGTISNEEAINGFLKVHKGEITNLGRSAFIGLLSDNPDIANIYDAIETIDRDDNGRIEDYETMAILIKEQKIGTSSSIDNEILALNPNYLAMKAEMDQYGIDWSLTGEAQDNDLRAIMLQIRNKEVNGTYFDLMLASMGKAALIEEKLLKELFDTNYNNEISDTELVQGLYRRFNNQISINPYVLDTILKKTPKYKYAYDLVKNNIDNGNTLSVQELANLISNFS